LSLYCRPTRLVVHYTLLKGEHNELGTLRVCSRSIMKPPMQEEVEDDLAAEEENKLINEVRTLRLLRSSIVSSYTYLNALRSTRHGM